MAKRRKRTNKNVPAKGRLRDMADDLWSLAIRDDWGHCCAVCGRGKCEAHHIVPRQHELTRYDLNNGIALCATCHKFDPNISPHQNAAGWVLWLEQHHPVRHAWYTEMTAAGAYKNFRGIRNHVHYVQIIQHLWQYIDANEFERVVGIRFSEYLAGER